MVMSQKKPLSKPAGILGAAAHATSRSCTAAQPLSLPGRLQLLDDAGPDQYRRCAHGVPKGVDSAAGASRVFNVIRLIDELLDAFYEIRRRWSRGESASIRQIGDGKGNLRGNLPDTFQRGVNPTCSKIGFGDFASQGARGSEKCLVGNKPAAAG